MKLQGLAIMFIILMLPISLVLESYTQSRVKTLTLQSIYDSKLNDATYDALKAYQLNSFNSDTSDYTNSKMRDIRASVNTFFNSMGTNFSTVGYTKDSIQSFVPAVVYTMYDGYYIYSPYRNTWDQQVKEKYPSGNGFSFEDGENLWGLKPYVYYSCRYRKSNFDIVITYSLDNYIQIQGEIDGKTLSVSGYLLNGEDIEINNTTGSVKYKGIEINNEVLSEKAAMIDNSTGDIVIGTYKYVKKKGTKYYLDESTGVVFTILNRKKIVQQGVTPSEITNNTNAKEYYKEAKDLYDFIDSNPVLSNLSVNDIVDSDVEYNNYGKIFNFEGIEKQTSNFNQHRMEVIKNTITKNLASAIANFNNFAGVSNDFQMPKLKETDWDKIMDNISIISFLQGVSIGGKIYNGYSIITNTKNEDVIMEDSIYMQTNDDIFHRATEKELYNQDIKAGVLNINTERRSIEVSDSGKKYYYPLEGALSYDSIVTQNKVETDEFTSTADYIDSLSSVNTNTRRYKSLYYTALGRERFGLYRPALKIRP